MLRHGLAGTVSMAAQVIHLDRQLQDALDMKPQFQCLSLLFPVVLSSGQVVGSQLPCRVAAVHPEHWPPSGHDKPVSGCSVL